MDGGVGRTGLVFPTTNWGRLAQATRSGDSTGREALSVLCQEYRPPVVAYLRRRGWEESEAQDLAQEFFLRLLESRAWQRADPARGRFRTFLLGALAHVVLHEMERKGAAKRGEAFLTSLDAMADEGFEPPGFPPDAVAFDREWALSVVDQAFSALKRRFEEDGASAEFAVLQNFLPGAAGLLSYEVAAERLGSSLPKLKTNVHRLRQDFRFFLRAAVAQTVATPMDVDDELLHLRQVLSNES